jgi:hypothetical protein
MVRRLRKVRKMVDSTLRVPPFQDQGLAPSNESSSPLPSLLLRPITFDPHHGSVRKGPRRVHVVLPRLLFEVGIQH